MVARVGFVRDGAPNGLERLVEPRGHDLRSHVGDAER